MARRSFWLGLVAACLLLTPAFAAPGDQECMDGLDNDGDTLIDFPADPDCANPNDNSEAPEGAETPTPTPTATATVAPAPTDTPTAAPTVSDGTAPVAAPSPESTTTPTPTPGSGGTAGFVLNQPAPSTQTSSRPVATVVVRIAGAVTRRGTRVRVLSVRAPLRAAIVARCSGTCPKRTVRARTSRRTVRLHAFERTLRPGTVLVVRVRVSGMVGRYTRLRMRAGKPPARRDACLSTHATRPVPC